MASFVRALLDRGHHVTYLTGESMQHLNLANYTEILVDPPFDFTTQCSFLIVIEARELAFAKEKLNNLFVSLYI